MAYATSIDLAGNLSTARVILGAREAVRALSAAVYPHDERYRPAKMPPLREGE